MPPSSSFNPDLVDGPLAYSDGLGEHVAPGNLYRVGLSRSELSSIRNLRRSRAEVDFAQFRALDIEPFDERMLERALGLLDRGKEWLIEPLRVAQPRSFALLSEMESELRCGYRAFYLEPPGGHVGHLPMPLAVIFVRDRAIAIEPYVQGWSPEDGQAGLEGVVGDYPDFLLNSWWYRVASWRLVRSLPGPVSTWAQPLLQQPTCGTSLKDIVRWMSPTHGRKYRPALIERFGADAYNKVYVTNRTALQCFIDTRPPETTHAPVGDQLFLNRGGKDKRIYHVRNGRFDQLRVLVPGSAPECMDRYFEHVLARVPGEFDFMPFTELA